MKPAALLPLPKKIVISLLFLLSALLAKAEVTLVLQSGQLLTGNILFQNEEVVVLQDMDGKRYQYPYSQISEIQEGVVVEQKEEVKRVVKGKRVGLSIHLTGGAGWLPKYNAGGSVGGDVYIGAVNVAQKHIFIGGGIGYHSYMHADAEDSGSNLRLYSFIPLQVRFSAPLMQTKHAPFLGASLGYGFCPRKQGQGGMYASMDAGWRCQLQERNALFVGLQLAMQQATATVTETLSDVNYTNTSIRTFCTMGVKVAIQF